MKFMLLTLFCVSLHASTLDSLLIQSKQETHQSKTRPGFILQRLTPPNKLMPLIPLEEIKKDTIPVLTGLHLPPITTQNYVTTREYDKDQERYQKQIMNLESEIAKSTIILTNLQNQASNQRKNLDIVVKIIEGLIALFGTFTTLIITLRKKK